MEKEKIMLLITAILETVLAIPILGGLIILASVWSILGVALVLHVITLIFLVQVKSKNLYGSISGIVASVLGWIPILGWILHVVSAILLWIAFVKQK